MLVAEPIRQRAPITPAERFVARLKGSYETWARTCYHIRDKRGAVRRFDLKDVQRHVGHVERTLLRTKGEARIFILKARQGGFSTDQQARNLFQIWSEPGFDALTLCDAGETTAKTFEITRRAIDRFPAALLPRTGDKESTEVSFPGLDTHFFTGTAGSKKSGRGLTLKRLHGSEFAFWPDPETTLSAATPALVPEGSVITLETTASGYDSPAHNFWRAAAAKGYERLFFAWWKCDRELYRRPLLAPDELGTLEDDERELVERRGLDLEQIKWRRAKMAEMGRLLFLTEYAEDAETCWASPGGMFYDLDVLQALMRRVPQPTATEMNGLVELFDPMLEPGERVVIGADTAEGVGGDRSTFAARAIRSSPTPSYRLVARFASNRVEPREFARILNTYGRRFGNAFLVPEKNAHGITVIRHLLDDHKYPRERIYHRMAHDVVDRSQASERIGWYTSAESKPILLDAGRELLNAARDGLVGVPSLSALRDAVAVRRDDTGRVSLNGKDDLVAEMLAWVGRSAAFRNDSRGSATAAL